MKTNEEAQSRRNHERELLRQSALQEAARTERIVYAMGAAPLAVLTLSDLQPLPGIMLSAALASSMLAYGLWFVNQYHASAWRIYSARSNADLIEPMAISSDEQVKKSKESNKESNNHSAKANKTAYLLMLYYLISSSLTIFALFDQHFDDSPFASVNQSLATVVLAAMLMGMLGLVLIELRWMYKEGWPSDNV